MKPQLLTGNRHKDERGIITFNNEFDASLIKRIYTIENTNVDFIRGWQGHKIESRWFACMKGVFEISVIQLNNFENPDSKQEIHKFVLTDEKLSYLHVPVFCVTAIQAKEIGSKLLVMSDYVIGEVKDEYRFDLECFRSR